MYKNIFKRIFDFLAALIGIILVFPLLMFLIIVLTISNNGKPFFYQPRTGKDGSVFTIIKLKTMNDKTDSNGVLLAGHKRITKIGNFCRKHSLDELPQLFNILKGNMSLIGPRPLLPKYLPRYNEEQKRRHLVVPGITGWAQVNGRNAISWEQKFELDNYYVDNQSFALDLKIFFKTIDKVISRKDIYSTNDSDMPEFMGTESK
ncbi:sugar transferase [Winogradskyella sp. PE311]|uniref:sugar transferase n=1 Tax=Winogradskyella sp. PE311 TaxID=3366943 RepID=UPI0039809C8D